MRLLGRIAQDKLAVASLIIIMLVLGVGALAPYISPHPPDQVDMNLRYAGASWSYWLGNDHLGRCILSRVIYGIRPSVLWVMGALSVSVALGALLGLAAGYFRGKLDAIVMRLCDVMLSFPVYVMTLAMVGIMGVGLTNILLAFVLMKWAWFARIIRTSVMQYADADYVKYSKATGMSHVRILYKHILPVTLPDIAVVASSAMGSMILQISGFSFLGLGIQAPHAEWGMMLNEARGVMFTKPELMLAPGLAIIAVAMAFNFFSDAIQVALDPKLASSRQARMGVRIAAKEVTYP
ncbi:ABC transporter permease subunit [Paenibacillus sp. J5C_2022]|uniref:staphylopine uptake ABC transporter permease subunit CntC n=1 Tax=Paenibacillus sp. J5C2022 TaxID=2977129 RepID=UPI0021D15AB0|nr:nickel/cobalt ABC transporter permease [Paenibacillus sp. J5C2022]MCU6711758.1 ABC transporter permease subunit [Paenibacillus sp. J5C2022]